MQRFLAVCIGVRCRLRRMAECGSDLWLTWILVGDAICLSESWLV